MLHSDNRKIWYMRVALCPISLWMMMMVVGSKQDFPPKYIHHIHIHTHNSRLIPPLNGPSSDKWIKTVYSLYSSYTFFHIATYKHIYAWIQGNPDFNCNEQITGCGEMKLFLSTKFHHILNVIIPFFRHYIRGYLVWNVYTMSVAHTQYPCCGKGQ